MPEQVPPAVARSFEALIPGAVILTITWLIRSVAGFDVNAALLSLFEPLTNILGNNLLGVYYQCFDPFVVVIWYPWHEYCRGCCSSNVADHVG